MATQIIGTPILYKCVKYFSNNNNLLFSKTLFYFIFYFKLASFYGYTLRSTFANFWSLNNAKKFWVKCHCKVEKELLR